MLALQFALKSVERRKDKTRQFGVLPKEKTGNRHQLATGGGTHASDHQRHTEKGDRCELPLSTAKDR